MKKRFKTIALAVIAAAALHAAPAFAGLQDCSAPGVLSFIDSRFDYKASHYLKRDLDISRLYNVHQNRLEGRDYKHPVERVYCHAKASMSDGHARDVWYLIERNWGFAGIGQNVEFCIAGIDPWHVYGRNCRSLR